MVGRAEPSWTGTGHNAIVLGALCIALMWANSAEGRGEWFVHGYVAQYTDTAVGEIVRLGFDFEPSWLATVGGGRMFGRWGDDAHFEWEVHTTRHWGEQHHGELNGILSVRWHGLPWAGRLPTSLAIGTGPSYAFTEPPLEERRDREATRYLQFLLLEAAVAPPAWGQWSGFVRVHHRSGAWGVIADAGGSNFIALGLRRHL